MLLMQPIQQKWGTSNRILTWKRLTWLNTKFQKWEGNQWIYTYPNNAKVHIDYIFINKKSIHSALNCEVYSSFGGVSTDHGIARAKIHPSQCKNITLTSKTTHYDWSLIHNRDISNKYMMAVINRFDNLQEISEASTLNDKYENFVNTHVEAAVECIPTKVKAKQSSMEVTSS